jgi:hypothetical protein
MSLTTADLPTPRPCPDHRRLVGHSTDDRCGASLEAEPSCSGIFHQETSMARYIDIHSGFVGATEEQLRAAHQSRRRVEDTEGVRFERSWLDPEYGKVFCLSTAPSKEAVLRVHELTGHPAAEVYEVPIEVC